MPINLCGYCTLSVFLHFIVHRIVISSIFTWKMAVKILKSTARENRCNSKKAHTHQ